MSRIGGRGVGRDSERVDLEGNDICCAREDEVLLEFPTREVGLWSRKVKERGSQSRSCFWGVSPIDTGGGGGV